MEPIRTLLDRSAPVDPILPSALCDFYGGDLAFPPSADDRPYVVGNFVSSVDGIVTFRIPGKSGGGEISGNNQPDRFVMGLLRASADAIMIGAGTLQATAPGHEWTPEAVYPAAAALYDSYRKTVLGKPEPAPTVIVSGSGVLDLGRPMFRNPRVAIRIFTTAKGRDRLVAAGAHSLPATKVVVLDPAAASITPAAMLQALHAGGVRLLLHEGGPTLFGEFVAAGLVDEYFLTGAPQIAGNDAQQARPTMVWGAGFVPETAPWLRLFSVKHSADHLFLRYAR